MGTKNKTPDVLDAMLVHVHYEAASAIAFHQIGNGLFGLVRSELSDYAHKGILEAGLIHFRCLIEFLGDEPKGSQVMARDYLTNWEWTISGSMVKVGELHGRLAHLGISRASVATEGPFEWTAWLNEQAPIVLAAFRDFLGLLGKHDPRRFALLDRGGLLAALDAMPGI